MTTSLNNIPVSYVPDFLENADELFQTLWYGLPWLDVAGPRLEYYCNIFNTPYTYGVGNYARTYQPQPIHPAIHEIWQALELAGYEFDVCFLNGYRDGSDHLGWHADDSPEMDDSRPIAIVSLGARREIYFRRNGDGPEQVQKLWLGSGSLCMMEAGMQDTHQHRIPKSSVHGCGPRISLTFRGLTKE